MLVRLALILLLPLFGVIAFLVAYFVFYQSGGYDAPPSVNIPLEQIDTVSIKPRVSSSLPQGGTRQGLLVVDAQHVNSFSERELVNFVSRVADRGFDVEYLGNFSRSFDPTQAQSRYLEMAEKLRRADSFAVILPRIAYSEREAALVERFVEKGGRLLLISDPGRLNSINSLAKQFGVDFQTDYLYNTSENDANFKRIFIRDFLPDQLTAGLDTVTLDYAGSVRSSGGGLAFASPSTESSLLSTVERLSPMAWGNSRNVLAIADFTFLVPNNDSLLDNGRLVSNVADFVTETGREFHLSDFPAMFQPAGFQPGSSSSLDGVDILLSRAELLNTGLLIKTGLAENGILSEIAAVDDVSRDTIFLGLYEDASQVSQYLQVAGVRVDDNLGTDFAGDLALENTTITILDPGFRDGAGGRDMLLVLADSPATLEEAVGRLISGEFRSDLVSDSIALRRFEEMDQ